MSAAKIELVIRVVHPEKGVLVEDSLPFEPEWDWSTPKLPAAALLAMTDLDMKEHMAGPLLAKMQPHLKPLVLRALQKLDVITRKLMNDETLNDSESQ